jgi:hypothetical protein
MQVTEIPMSAVNFRGSPFPVSPWLEAIVNANLAELQEQLSLHEDQYHPNDELDYVIPSSPSLSRRESDVTILHESPSRASRHLSAQCSVDPAGVDIQRFSLITGHQSNADNLITDSFIPRYSDASSSDHQRDSVSLAGEARQYLSVTGAAEFEASPDDQCDEEDQALNYWEAHSPAPTDWHDPLESVPEVIDLRQSSDEAGPPPTKKKKFDFVCDVCGRDFKYKGGLGSHHRKCKGRHSNSHQYKFLCAVDFFFAACYD